jgi:hypothetical protein
MKISVQPHPPFKCVFPKRPHFCYSDPLLKPILFVKPTKEKEKIHIIEFLYKKN